MNKQKLAKAGLEALAAVGAYTIIRGTQLVFKDKRKKEMKRQILGEKLVSAMKLRDYTEEKISNRLEELGKERLKEEAETEDIIKVIDEAEDERLKELKDLIIHTDNELEEIKRKAKNEDKEFYKRVKETLKESNKIDRRNKVENKDEE
jgi:hypothetical protein